MEAEHLIRSATPNDVPLIARLVHALAEYEKLTDQLDLDEARLHDNLFGPRPVAEALIAEHGGDPVGYALYFSTFSTFLMRPGIWLEDLFVLPASRGRGIGRALLARVAATAVARGCGRLEWSVLDWNESAIGFYRTLGARPVDGWTTYRMTGAALRELAG